MIYKITAIEDSILERVYKESLNDLNAFYEINWEHHLPKIIVVDDRETINSLKGEQTESWVIGWSEGKTIYVLNKDNFEKESNHKYDAVEYAAFVKHELSHSFYNVLSKGQWKPVWLNEGVAIYTSGQNKFKKQPIEFKNLLESYDFGKKQVYDEAGFVVGLLIERYGKKKLLELISNLSNTKSESDFSILFNKVYSFEPNYKNLNSLFA